MKTYILYNPKAGNGEADKARETLKSTLAGEIFEQDITKTDAAALVTSLTSEDAVIICGGDGTLNHFANDVYGIDFPCDVLCFAVGTGNDFLRDIGGKVGEPISIKKYLSDLPVVEVNGREARFLNGIGYGIDGYCCEMGDKAKAENPGKPVNYTAIAIKGLLFHYKPANATVTVDGQKFTYKKAWIAATMKGRYYGGGMICAPEQDRLADDGEVTLVLMYGKGKIKTLMVFPSIFKGEHVKHTEMVAVHKGKEITVAFDRPSALQIDGETVLNVSEYRVKAGAAVLVKA